MEDEWSDLPYRRYLFWAYVGNMLVYRFLSHRLAAGVEELIKKKKVWDEKCSILPDPQSMGLWKPCSNAIYNMFSKKTRILLLEKLGVVYFCFYFTPWFFRVKAKGKGKNKGNGRQKEKEGLEEEKALLWQPKVLSIVKFLTGDVK